MDNYSYNLSYKHIYPNALIYERCREGLQVGWKVVPYSNFTLSTQRKEKNEDGEDTIVTMYHNVIYLPLNYNWDKIHFNVVPKEIITNG